MKTNVMRLLNDKGIEYEIKMHKKDVFTVNEAAKERGVRPAQVTKCMLVKKQNGDFILAMIPGDRKLSLKKLRKKLSDPQTRLASTVEVSNITGYPVGAVSPLGIKNNLSIYYDPDILKEKYVTISSGNPQSGILLKSADLKDLIAPEIISITGS